MDADPHIHSERWHKVQIDHVTVSEIQRRWMSVFPDGYEEPNANHEIEVSDDSGRSL